MTGQTDGLPRRDVLKKGAAVCAVGAYSTAATGTATEATDDPTHQGDQCCETADDGILVAEMTIPA